MSSEAVLCYSDSCGQVLTEVRRRQKEIQYSEMVYKVIQHLFQHLHLNPTTEHYCVKDGDC